MEKQLEVRYVIEHHEYDRLMVTVEQKNDETMFVCLNLDGEIINLTIDEFEAVQEAVKDAIR